MLKDTFCSSPWLNIRFGYDGTFSTCRWAKNGQTQYNIKDTNIMKFYNSDEMKKFRTTLLNGKTSPYCANCNYEDKFDKLSGRIRQLGKSGVRMDDFELSLRASPHYDHFKHSNDTHGESNGQPVDLQIDLSTICNSGCIMCSPSFSSRLVPDFKKLHAIEPELFQSPPIIKSWSENQELLDRVIGELIEIKNLRYVHFLGGETLFDESMYKMCEAFIASGKSKSMIIGTTTNGTIYDERLENIIKEFDQFHLGISIESVTSLNNYIRYPSMIGEVLGNLDKFLNLREQFNGLKLCLRITPNIFTIYELDQLFEYMIERDIIAESCNILHYPEWLRIENMPQDIRDEVTEKFAQLIKRNQFEKTDTVNIRNSNLTKNAIGNMAVDYHNFLINYPVPDIVEDSRTKLVKFLKSFESIRNNIITDYAPRYTDFLRTYGY